ncbi:MAG: HD domain-containing phosphohydrolase [Coriobacteriia bacterium]|nr:HD domain-containing phosphohydrolase [Coriobacteriia bacterium]
MGDMRQASQRETQLDVISSVLILAMVAVVGLLLWLMTSNGVALPIWFPLADYIPRVLLGGFVILVVLYLWDQRRRLRIEIEKAWAETEATKTELNATCNWLAFSHDAASKLGTDGVETGMREVLADAAALFDADAAAVLGEDNEYTYVAQGAPRGEAERALTHVALVAAGNASPLLIQSLGTEEGQAIAVPLRVQEDLRYVLCIWRRKADFTTEQLDALGLMGRMVELAIEREESLGEAQSQLEGTLRVLQYLVADKRPDYSRHAVGVAELSAGIGHKLGLRPAARKDLRLAGLVHDVGMMSLPQDVGDAGKPLSAEETMMIRQHPRIGAEIAKAANFNVVIQEAVAGHHERMDGSGYPLGLRGTRIPLEARILAVCEVYDSMTHRTYHGTHSKPEDALEELRQNSGSLYDATVVSALLEIVSDAAEVPAMTANLFEEPPVHAAAVMQRPAELRVPSAWSMPA